MSRKNITITLNDRGKELKFRVYEMPATQLESWTVRAVLLLARGGKFDGVAKTAGQGDFNEAAKALLAEGLTALSAINYEEAKPLLDEMLGCCSRVVGSIEEKCTPDTVDGYIDDIATLLKLRMEALKLNFGFFTEMEAVKKLSSRDSKATISIPKKERN